MTEQFQEQGGAATMDPGRVRRWLTSKMMTVMSSEKRQKTQHFKTEENRIKSGEPHRIEYFHQVEDGYSHLAVQVIQRLVGRYQAEFQFHMVGGAVGDNSPEPDLLLRLSRYDAYHVAPHYGLDFPEHSDALSITSAQQAAAILAAMTQDQFVVNASEVSKALWSGDTERLEYFAQNIGVLNPEQTNHVISQGEARRAELKHYSGGMFYYGGEWYWGVDRLYHLEKRLAGLGLDRTPGEPLLVPRPPIEVGPQKDTGRLTLEIYPSLRSPYTAVIFDQTVELAKHLGINLTILPVLPMVMRGVPATREKGSYILLDAGREARALGVRFGPCADPIGEPTRRAYSLLAWAEEQGRLTEFFSSFLNCAWRDAINTNSDRGMRHVVERAGLDWTHAKEIIGKSGWQESVETNRLAMYDMGLWGVPSYRLLDEQGESLLELWGQDRLWVVAREIQNQLRALDQRETQ